MAKGRLDDGHVMLESPYQLFVLVDVPTVTGPRPWPRPARRPH